MTASVFSLFDVEDETELPRVRDMTVGPASTGEVAEFCKRYHYTQTGGNMTWRYGLWHGAVLWGVVAYNLPTREVCESVFGPEGFDKVWHMGRLVLSDSAPKNSESRLIGGSLRMINRDHDVWGVVTYAATDAGHTGYVYQATNAIYTGAHGEPWYFTDTSGAIRSVFQQGHRLSVERIAELGWTRHKAGPKHRYLYILGNKKERRERLSILLYPTLPYPKAFTP